MPLQDKVAIVTGAAQGIGQRYAERLADAGARVVIADIQEDKAQQVAAEIVAGGGSAVAISVDLSDQASMRELFRRSAEEFGGIDILVQNGAIYAGYTRYLLMELPRDYWQWFLNVNLTGVLMGSQEVIPYMRARGGGRIVNVSSDASASCYNHYAMTKLGVQGLTVGFARLLGKYNITVNCLAPGPINTEATLGHFGQDGVDRLVKDRLVLQRVGTPDDMAGGLMYLVSDEAQWVTGQTLRVNGGMVMYPA